MIHLNMALRCIWIDIFGAQVGSVGTWIDTLSFIYLNCKFQVLQPWLIIISWHPDVPGLVDLAPRPIQMAPRQIL